MPGCFERGEDAEHNPQLAIVPSPCSIKLTMQGMLGWSRTAGALVWRHVQRLPSFRLGTRPDVVSSSNFELTILPLLHNMMAPIHRIWISPFHERSCHAFAGRAGDMG